MSASKLIKKLLKGGNKKSVGGSSASATIACSPSPPPVVASNLQAPPPQITSRFLSLPGEIRNKIYALTIYPTLSTISLHRAPEIVLSLPLFAICRQMRSEAISKLCSSKSFCLFGLPTANAFFERIAQGVRDLRSVTIYCETDWRSERAEMVAEKADLVSHLELATSLRSLHVILGHHSFTVQDKSHLMNAASEGARFLHQIRGIVDRERFGVEEERAMQEELSSLYNSMGALQAVRLLGEKLTKEHEERVEKVFRLRKVVSLEGNAGSALLPLRMPEYLMGTEKNLDTKG